MMNKYVVEFTLVGEGAIFAACEEEAKQIIKDALEKSASLIGTELADISELVHISASRLHTLRIVKRNAPSAGNAADSDGRGEPEASAAAAGNETAGATGESSVAEKKEPADAAAQDGVKDEARDGAREEVKGGASGAAPDSAQEAAKNAAAGEGAEVPVEPVEADRA